MEREVRECSLRRIKGLLDPRFHADHADPVDTQRLASKTTCGPMRTRSGPCGPRQLSEPPRSSRAAGWPVNPHHLTSLLSYPCPSLPNLGVSPVLDNDDALTHIARAQSGD